MKQYGYNAGKEKRLRYFYEEEHHFLSVWLNPLYQQNYKLLKDSRKKKKRKFDFTPKIFWCFAD